MARRRRPHESRTTTTAAAALLGLAFSGSAAEALRPDFLSRNNNAHPASVAVQHHCSFPPGPGSSGDRSLALAALSPSGRRGARVWRLEAAGYGPAFGQETEEDDEETAAAAAAAATTARNTRLIQTAAAVRMATTQKAMSAAAEGQESREQGKTNETGRKRAMLRRMRRRAKAKIKAIPTLKLDSSGERGGATKKSGMKNSSKKPKPRINIGRRSDADTAPVEGNSSGDRRRGGQRKRNSKRKSKSKSRGWGVGAVGSAVFGRPVRFVRRNLDTCKSFVSSRERIHWASLFMATYILSTSVVPRLPTST